MNGPLPRPLAAMLCFCACLLVGMFGPTAPAFAADVAAAVLEQQTLPALGARRQAAQARSRAAQAWLAGTSQLGEAFPDLDGAPLDAVGFVDGQLRELDMAGASRAVARVGPAPDDLSGRSLARWQAAHVAALDAEEAADALRRRFLLGVRGGLARAPGLVQARTEAEVLAPWRDLAEQVPAADAPAEEADRVLSLAAAAGRAIAALEQYKEAAWRRMTVAGDVALPGLVSADLEAPPVWRADPAQQLRVRAWSDRLERVLPLLDPAQQAAVQAARDAVELQRLDAALPQLRARRDALLAQLESTPELPADVEVESLEAVLTATEHALAELPPVDQGDDSPLSQRQAEERTLRRAVAQAEVELAAARLARARELAEQRARVAVEQADVDEAERKVAESKARAAASATQQEAEYRESLARLQAEIALGLKEEASRHRTALLALQELEQRWRAVDAEADAAIAMAPLAVGREARIDGAYRDLRDVVSALRHEVSGRREHLSQVRASRGEQRARIPDPGALPGDVRAAVANELAAIEADLDVVYSRRIEHALAELDGALTLLAFSKVDRRKIRSHASARARDDILQSFMPEARLEALEAPAVVSAELRRTAAAVRALPGQVTDLNLILSFMRRSFEVVLLGIAWIALRRNAEGWARRLLDALARYRASAEADRSSDERRLSLRGWFVDGDLRSLAAPLAPVLFAVADVGVAYGLFRLARGSLTPLALLLLIWVARSIYKGAPAVLGLLWATPDEVRPALSVVSKENLERGRRSLKVMLFAFLSLTVLHFVALELFDADRFADLVNAARLVVYLGVALWLLSTWAEAIRGGVAATGDTDKLAVGLTKQESNPFLRLVRASGGLAYLGGRNAAELLVRVAEGRPGLGWLASALARARLRNSADDEADALPVTKEILIELDEARAEVPRPTQLEAMDQAMTAWGEERRRGMIAIIGDRGSGKTHMLALADARAKALLPELPVRQLRLTERLSDSGPALHWLARVTGVVAEGPIKGEADVEALAQAISDLPTSVFLIDDMHRLVLRAVGGFGAARAVLRIMMAASEEHLWVCAFHRPTWNYLTGVGTSINLEAFRCRVDLASLPAAQLGEWAKQRVTNAGFSVGFDGLISGNPVGLDAQRARERAEQAYWRLLGDASMGIPDVAWGYFRSSLRIGRGVRALDARMFEAPSSSDLEGLPDLELFVLTAVVIHDELDSAAIGEVLNAPLAEVQEACRQLDGLDVLSGDRSGSGWIISPRWRPAVQRILRQKHFLYMR